MPEIHVCSASEISDGGRKLISHKDREIGIIRVGEEFFAYQNICPHQGGPVCEGMLIHRVEEVIGEDNTYRGMTFNEDVLHLTCPWHGWEFDVRTGACAGDGKHKLRRFKVEERDGELYVAL